MDETSKRNAEMHEWLSGSAFVVQGRPIMLFHGTDVEDFNVFARWEDQSIGFHFGTADVANARLRDIHAFDEFPEGDRIIPVICRASNPLRLRDLFCWDPSAVVGALSDAGVVRDWEIDISRDHYTDELMFAAMELAGFDCVLYGNESEDKANGSDSLMIWRTELVKGLFASAFDRSEPRLLPQCPACVEEMEHAAWMSTSIAESKRMLLGLRRGLASNPERDSIQDPIDEGAIGPRP